MLAVGVDLIEVARLERSLERFGQRFLDRIFTKREQRFCNGHVQRLAARFAAKEATSKALGTGIGYVCWREIEIVNEENGRPLLLLHGAALRLAREKGLDLWEVSLSHTKTQAVGMVVAINSGRRD